MEFVFKHKSPFMLTTLEKNTYTVVPGFISINKCPGNMAGKDRIWLSSSLCF